MFPAQVSAHNETSKLFQFRQVCCAEYTFNSFKPPILQNNTGWAYKAVKICSDIKK